MDINKLKKGVNKDDGIYSKNHDPDNHDTMRTSLGECIIETQFTGHIGHNHWQSYMVINNRVMKELYGLGTTREMAVRKLMEKLNRQSVPFGD